MLRAQTEIKTEKSQKYIDMLGKHFSRKVSVETKDDITQVNFPMGLCYMTVNNDAMSFLCEAEKEENLNQVKGIIAGHIVLIKELKETPISWSS